MMLDADVVAESAASVYRVLKRAGVLDRFQPKASGQGKGFQQPDHSHRHWHVDVAYLNIAGTIYFLTSILDGYRNRNSRMTELTLFITLPSKSDQSTIGFFLRHLGLSRRPGHRCGPGRRAAQ
jgi:hypothetical protein